MPGARPVAPDRREGMHRYDRRNMPALFHALKHRRNRRVVGLIEPRDTPVPLHRIDIGVVGDERAVGNPHDDGRIVLAAIGINQQAREGRPPHYRE